MEIKYSKKKGIFFTTDALIALIIILLSIFVIYPVVRYSQNPNFIKGDVIDVLSTLKIGEIDNPVIKQLINESKITDLNKTILEQIGEFYVTNLTLARNISQSIFSNLNTTENIGLWFGPGDEGYMASKNSTPYVNPKNVEVDTMIITGIGDPSQVNGSTSAFSARAYLTNSIQSKYFYFGGYYGEGNVTAYVDCPGKATDIQIEIATSQGFDVLINNNFSGSWGKSTSEFTPKVYNLTEYAENYTVTGMNTFKFVSNRSFYIAGGHIKISYINSSLNFEQSHKKYFPGIEGLINIYDGLSIPGSLNNLSIYLHYNSSYDIFLTIGNISVYNGSSNGTDAFVLRNNSDLVTILNYSDLSNITTPLRLGLSEITGGGQGGNADVILITDVSGSMDWRLDQDGSSGNGRNCNDPLLYNSNTKRVSLAKCIDINFTATVLSGTGNRIGLVAFSTDANSNNVNLTSNKTLLNNTIMSYAASGSTCISCAINRAYELLKANSGPNRKRFIVVMSDGMPNYRSTNTCYDLFGLGIFNRTNPFAGGSNGILINRSFTETWGQLTSPTSNQLNDLDFFNSTYGFGVGNSGTIIKWDGSSWNTISSYTTDNINGLNIFNSSFALSVGDNGRVGKWNGASWTNLANIVNSPTLYSIGYVNSTLWFASGWRSNRGRIYKSVNEGVSWTENFTTSGNTVLRGIKMINRTLGFAVGDGGYVARWNGNSWSSMAFPTGDDLYGIDSYNSSEIYAGGGDTSNSNIFKYNGASWNLIYNYFGLGPVNNLVTFNKSIYGVGSSLLILENNGTNWVRNFNLPYPQTTLYQGNSTTGNCYQVEDCSLTVTLSYPSSNANYSSCRAHNELNSKNYVVGFGPIGNCIFGNNTLKSIAECGNGSYLASTNATALQEFYQQIAYDILKVSYGQQPANVTGNIMTKLYPDSYIEYYYNKTQTPYGLVITLEKQFDNNYNGSFTIPKNSTLADVKAISYSGPNWTNTVKINQTVVYNLSKYPNEFADLGDPYSINIPINFINTNPNVNNTVEITTGISSQIIGGGSQSNKVIYTIIKDFVSYSVLAPFVKGCNWTIEFEGGKNMSMSIPSDYSGDNCSYTYDSHSREDSYQYDALKDAVYNLLVLLDFNNDGKLDVKFSEQNFQINSSELSGVPWHYSVEAQVRKWY